MPEFANILCPKRSAWENCGIIDKTMIENKPDSFEIDENSLRTLSAGLNSEQLSAVRESRNVVVSAGAGSGKTTVLASRYAYLVEAKNISPEKILTLTFTKKAANEMKERIFIGLKNHLNGYPIKRKSDTPPLPVDFPHLDKIKERSKSAVEHFDRAHIQTLDSYFSEIAKKGARYYGITPNFSLDDEKISSTINYLATKYVLEHLDEPEIKEIAQIFQIQNVASELFAQSILRYSTILTPIDFDSALQKQKVRLLQDYDRIASELSDEIDSFIRAFSPSGSGKTREKMRECIAENGNPPAPRLSEKSVEDGEAGILTEYLSAVSEYFSSDFSYLRDDSYKNFKEQAFPLLERLYSLANSISGFSLQKKIFVHLKKFQEDVNRSKRVGGFLSFADVSQLALASLSEHDEIRHIEQNKFDAIMIDEFQDDNQLQCDVLLILSDRHEKYDADKKYLVPSLSDPDLLERLDTHKLFFVGDDKQSIYRFRGADVSVFRNLAFSIKNLIELRTNYRSEPGLIEGFNTIFGGYDYPSGKEVNESFPAVFMTRQKFSPWADGGGRIPDYEADYKRAEVPDFKLSGCDFSKKKITLALYPKNDDEEAGFTGEEPSSGENENFESDRKIYECEAGFVAAEIKKLVSEKDGNGNQRYHYKDMALLFRSATPTGSYENALLEAGIPYSTEVYKGFFSDGPINDIISFLKLCVYPEDKNAWAKVLRSPFCSLNFAELEKILVSAENPYKMPFDENMLSAISGTPEILEKIMNLKTMYDDINSRLKTEKLTKTISYIWYELGYRYETLWNKSVSMYSSFYDILFEMARLAEDKTRSLASFIDMVKSYEDSDKKLDGLDVVMEGEDAVQILTVHKSKGLEFKIVFVCAASAVSRAPASGISLTDEFGFLLKTPEWPDYQKAAAKLAASGAIRKKSSENYFSALSDKENERQECAELRRLAYVAFTRAEEKLYIVGNSNGEFEDEEKSLRFELHDEETDGFSFTRTHEKKNGELVELKNPKEVFVEYESPKSIYQLLLPMLFQGNCDAGIKNPAFDFVGDKEAFRPVLAESGAVRKKSDFIKNLAGSENLEVIEEKLSPKVYASPSRLHDLVFSGKKIEAVQVNPEYELINKIVASSVPCASDMIPSLEDGGEEITEQDENLSPAFSFANFGTIAHAYLEGKILSAEPKISGREWIGLNERFIPGVNLEKWQGSSNRERKILKIRELCSDMAERFVNSSIYKECRASPWKKTEYSFRSLMEKSFFGDNADDYADEVIVTGQIDLVYQNPNASKYKYTIVDFKTNQKIEPEIYYKQLSCYKKTLGQMLACDEREIRCALYYLRFAAEIDITEDC